MKMDSNTKSFFVRKRREKRKKENFTSVFCVLRRLLRLNIRELNRVPRELT